MRLSWGRPWAAPHSYPQDPILRNLKGLLHSVANAAPWHTLDTPASRAPPPHSHGPHLWITLQPLYSQRGATEFGRVTINASHEPLGPRVQALESCPQQWDLRQRL